MRIVLKIKDDSPLGLFLKQRMEATGLEVSTIARSILFQAMKDAQPETGEPPTLLPRIESAAQPIEQVADNDDSDDDNAILLGLLDDM